MTMERNLDFTEDEIQKIPTRYHGTLYLRLDKKSISIGDASVMITKVLNSKKKKRYIIYYRTPTDRAALKHYADCPTMKEAVYLANAIYPIVIWLK